MLAQSVNEQASATSFHLTFHYAHSFIRLAALETKPMHFSIRASSIK